MTTKWVWLAGVVTALAVLAGVEAGWAACCKCVPCPEPGVACFTTIDTQDDCVARCPAAGSGVCGFDSFDANATCGQNAFADCTIIDGQQRLPVTSAPVMSMPAVGVTVLILLVAGVGLTARQARRGGKHPSW
ncbi:MAG: hypothetical protein H6Q33_425 [Deltaproteobacteria bacterium]|nr:hypothetical protein [Deltaproteobacteria bacterium]